jgi:ketosteroid isomerase-like protein
MNKKTYLLLVTFLSILSLCSCKKQDTNSHKAEEIEYITQTISSCIGWFKEKDFDLLFSIVAHDSNYISIHPTNKVIRGFDDFVKNVEVFKNPDFKYVRHKLKDLKINISSGGNVAWFFCYLDDINSWKGQPANWENARWTGVLEKREGRWVIIQQHFSFAVD